ncbi:hypothetical protein [Mycoplasma sp. P36-A1]|uniref:hypothetical protein n=1 Tax=Mycoplasma sp. P36-A1 TaxID=3252900 RepID=UPI003C2DF5EE
MNKKTKSIFGLLFAFLIGVTSLFATTTSVHASSNLAIEKTNYAYSGVSSITGNTVNDNIWKL